MKRAGSAIWALLLGLSCVLNASAKAKDKVEHGSFTFEGHQRTYMYEIPSAADTKAPLPVIVLLHDQGGWASDVISFWRSYASRIGAIVIAPEALSNTLWNSQTDGPAFLHSVVAEVNKIHPVDLRRAYLFGERGGGTYAMEIGLFDSNYWAATAVHGAIMSPANYYLFKHAERKEPFGLWMGGRDPNLSIDQVTNEQAAFKAAGFPFLLKVDSFASGAYVNDYDEVNEGAWKFFQQYELPAAGGAGSGS